MHISIKTCTSLSAFSLAFLITVLLDIRLCLPFAPFPLNQTGHTSNCYVQIHSLSRLDSFPQKKGLSHPKIDWNKTSIKTVSLVTAQEH